MIKFIFLFLLLLSNVYAQEVLPGKNYTDEVVVLNNEIRKVRTTNAELLNSTNNLINTTYIKKIYDYGASLSAYTEVNQSSLMFCYGNVTIANESFVSITNLPFASASSYIITIASEQNTTTAWTVNVAAYRVSGSTAIIRNPGTDTAKTVIWQAVGT